MNKQIATTSNVIMGQKCIDAIDIEGMRISLNPLAFSTNPLAFSTNFTEVSNLNTSCCVETTCTSSLLINHNMNPNAVIFVPQPVELATGLIDTTQSIYRIYNNNFTVNDGNQIHGDLNNLCSHI